MVAAGPGNDSTATLCSNGALVSLFDYLGGSPDPGGTWSGPAAHPGQFDPATDPPGVYTYSVTGPPPGSATVTVTVVDAPDAGINGTATYCSSDPAVNLFTLLGGTPDAGGAWT
ncbi:MAG: hypothetical protein KJZ58_13270, partial [Flavobacteriales bacterium]|nr:hypothetical protein [Flavobacteriales bacterium]